MGDRLTSKQLASWRRIWPTVFGGSAEALSDEDIQNMRNKVQSHINKFIQEVRCSAGVTMKNSERPHWVKAEGSPPPSGGDSRKLVWLVDKDGFGWIGIRYWRGDIGSWMVGNSEEVAVVTHWMDLPPPPTSPREENK